MTRAQLHILPAPAPSAPKPFYPRWPVCAIGTSVDRRESWRLKREAEESERNRAASQEMSRAVTTTRGEGNG